MAKSENTQNWREISLFWLQILRDVNIDAVGKFIKNFKNFKLKILGKVLSWRNK